eukprot:364188-Chlamydomonas_euryale.AAC.11
MVVRFLKATNFELRDGRGEWGLRRRLAPHYLRQPNRLSQPARPPDGSFLDVAWHGAAAQAKRIADNDEAAKTVQASPKQSKMSAFLTRHMPDQMAERERHAEHERKAMQQRGLETPPEQLCM